MPDHVSTRKKRMKSFARTPPRLHWVFSRSPLFFVTFCTYSRRSILARAEVHAAFIEFADRAHREFGIGWSLCNPFRSHPFVCRGARRLQSWEIGRHVKACSRRRDSHG